MYRGRLWTMRQYAGFGTAAESNARYRYLLAQGVSGLSVAFDLPTQMGYDSDHPLAAGEVGRVGVAIDSIDDMAALFDGIPLDRVSTSMTINSTAIILLALYVAVARRQGHAARHSSSGTIQNDILKEYIARGTYIYPPRHSLRIVTDIFAWCERELPNWNTISISGYHIREAGSTAVQEVAFTLANAIAYVEAARRSRARRRHARPAAVVLLRRAQRLPRGDREVPRGAAAVGAHHARPVRRDEPAGACSCAFTRRRPAARSPRSSRTTTSCASPIQALAAVLGGTQSLHCNGRDEALALPTEDAARIALRTQQIIAAETGVGEHGRSGRRRVGDRAANGRDRGGGARAHRDRSTPRAARWRRSRPAGFSGRFRTRRTPRSRPSTAATQVIVGVNRYRRPS